MKLGELTEVLVVSRNKASFLRALELLYPGCVNIETTVGLTVLTSEFKFVHYSRNRHNINGQYSNAKMAYCVEEPHKCEFPPTLNMNDFLHDAHEEFVNAYGIKILGVLEDPKSNEYSTTIKNKIFERIG